MFTLGVSQFLVLALISNGMNSTDFVAMVQPTHYFQSRKIDLSIDKMMEIASRDPKDPKTQVQQLLALRYLGDEVDQLKKSANFLTHRQTLEKIAQRKLADDPLGFAQSYAGRLLGRLDGAKLRPQKRTPLRDDALSWFPANTKFAAAIEIHDRQATSNDPLKELQKRIPDHGKKELYDAIEKSGNVGIERIAFAMVNTEKRDDQKAFVRVTGKFNHEWLADAIKTVSAGNLEAVQMKAADGIPLTLFRNKDGGLAVMLVGTTDLMIQGYQKLDGKHQDVFAEVLEVRAKKKPSATTGLLKSPLAKLPVGAIALMVGELPDELKREFRVVLDPAPANISAYIERTPMGLDLRVETTMANRQESDKLVQALAELRKAGIANLRRMQKPSPPGAPKFPFQPLLDVVESLQVQSKTEKVQASVFVPNVLLDQLGEISMLFVPLPPPKEEEN